MPLPVWSTACPDWERRIVAGESLVPFPPLFPAEAAAALDVFGALRIVDAVGSPTFAEAARPWVFDLPNAVFGAYDPESGRRLVREFFLLISKKNGKSTDAAAIMVTALLRNWRPSGEFYILAPTLEVANNAFFPARDAIKADQELSELLHIKEAERTIIHRVTRAFLKVVAADSQTVSGKKAIGVFVDELWLFGGRVNAARMFREATGGLASRNEGFVIWASTQSDEPPTGIFKDKLAYFRDVRDGKIIDPRSLPIIYEFPPPLIAAKAYLDPANWHITNPNLGVSVDTEWLADELGKAQAAGDHSSNIFVAKHLNVEIGQTLRGDRWAGADFWAQAADPTLTLATLLARSEVVVIGLDGGGLNDLMGIAVVGREKDSGRWLSWGLAMAHISALQRNKSVAAALVDFARAGDLEVFDAFARLSPDELADLTNAPDPGPSLDLKPNAAPVPLPPDVQALAALVERIKNSGLLAIVGMDPYGVGLIVEGLKTIGVWESDPDKPDPEIPLIGVTQGYKLMGPIRTAERKLADRTLLHAEQPLLSWAVGNAKVELKGNAAMITKAAAGALKIDPLMALLTALNLMSTNPEPAGSVYSADRGLVVFG